MFKKIEEFKDEMMRDDMQGFKDFMHKTLKTVKDDTTEIVKDNIFKGLVFGEQFIKNAKNNIKPTKLEEK